MRQGQIIDGPPRLSLAAVGWRLPSLFAVLLTLGATAVPAPVPQTLRVGTSGDYAPFSIVVNKK